MDPKQSKQVVSAWLAFIALGLTLAFLTPLGEGFDELWHFAYIQRVAQAADVPLGHSHFVSEEAAAFLQTYPVGWVLHSNYPFLVSYDDYWNEDSAAYDKTNRSIRDLHFSGTFAESHWPLSGQYERHQPPLYYVLSAPVFALASHHLSFVNTFFVLRVWSVLLASLVVPGAYFLASRIFEDAVWTKCVLLLTVLFPGLYPGVVRVSNDALAVPVASLLLGCLIAFLQTQRRAYFIAVCAFLAVGLATKAFFIPLFAGTLALLLIYKYFREAVFLLLVGAIGGEWYFYNFAWTGSFTGLPETVLSGSSLGSSLHALGRMEWRTLADMLRSTHIWIGNWSFLNVRSWMSKVIAWTFLFGAAGVAGYQWNPQRRALTVLVLNYLLFMAALVYFATQSVQHSGSSVAAGWYLTLMIPAEAVLFVAGLRVWFTRRWPLCVACFAFALLALNLYANFFVMLPYYAGMTIHDSAGRLKTFHPSAGVAHVMLDRLLRFSPWLPRLVPLAFTGFFAAFALWWISSLLRENQP